MAPLFSKLKTLLLPSVVITSLSKSDVRFPTSACGTGHGSDALHKDPNYSAAYVVLTAGNSTEGKVAIGFFVKIIGAMIYTLQ